MNSASEKFPLTDMQAAYMVGKSRLIELGGRQNYYIELDAVGFDPARAERALNCLIRRQEHLRTVMMEDGYQEVLDPDEVPHVPISVVDLTKLSRADREAALQRTRDRMCEGLDPAGWPLFEVATSLIRRHRARVHLRMSLILLDGPSIRMVLSEWGELYKNPEAALPALSYTFREWRLALLDYEATEAFQKKWQYWEARLDSLPEAPQLPLARHPRAIERVVFNGRRTFLTKSQWQQFCSNFRKHKVLPTTALLHVYAETLGAWAATPHFCLNVVHQNLAATHPGSQDVVGQRSATLPLEADLRDRDFWARARKLQRQLFKDMANSDVTAVRISRELAARGGWTQRVALPYVFTSNQGPGWDSGPRRRPAFRLLERIQHTPQVLIDDQIRDAPDGGISSMLDFVDEAFPPGLPDAMVETYRRLLRALSGPDGADVQPDLISPRHRNLIAAINATAAAVPAGRLEDGFLRQATARPGATAVVTAQRTLTYLELEESSRAVAEWLIGRGVRRADIVPVVMVKGWEQVVAVLGVLRAGAAYCPIDAKTPERLMRELLDRCGAKTILVQSYAKPDFGEQPSLAVLDVDQAAAPSVNSLPATGASPADLAYIIYTSGSTGQPKGVMIEHRSALNTVLDINERVGLGEADRVFDISSLSFDLSVWDIFGALNAGAALVIPEASVRPEPLQWLADGMRHDVTVWNSVPALAEMLAEIAGERPELGRPPVRVFLLSGDWIPTKLPGWLRRIWPDARVIGMGGATEASIWSNIYEIDEVDPGWRSIPYGKPLKNQTMVVLDDRLDIRPPWAVGHIYIGGSGLARGYWRDEERTAERFIRHPETGERLYWTGDLGRYWPDGTIEFLGREDRQVKVQGFRVELGEIETAIRTHPAVRECVVSVDAAPGGQRRLVSLVVSKPDQPADSQSVASHLRARLPYYMIPGLIHVVERLPLTPNGKVDVARALAMRPAPEPQAAERRADTPLTKQLAELWAELLQVPAVDQDTNFFTLGGNSLLALRMVNRVRTDFGVDLPLGRAFEAPTIREFADCVEHGDRRPACAVELSGGTGEELFAFHVLGGSITRYVPLARTWAGPVRAFQSRALVDPTDDAFAPDLETMAAAYREELQRHKPEGPYILGGLSMGGVIAYEVARQLAARGEKSRVIMLDSELRAINPPVTEVGRHLAFLMVLNLAPIPEAAEAAVRDAAPPELAQTARDTAVAHGFLPAEVDLQGYERLMRIQEHELAVLAAYRPGPLEQPALLFVAAEEADRADPVPAWRAVCPGIDVETVPGDHFTIGLKDDFSAIVSRIGEWLTHQQQSGR